MLVPKSAAAQNHGRCAVQVFRTYNASVTLDRLLTEQEQEQSEAVQAGEAAGQRLESPTVDKRKADYDRANKEASGKLQGRVVWLLPLEPCSSLHFGDLAVIPEVTVFCMHYRGMTRRDRLPPKP